MENEEVIIMFKNDDEYGHWDILGVFTSEEEMQKGWQSYQNMCHEYDRMYSGKFLTPYYPRNFGEILDWDSELKAAKEKYGESVCLGGDGYYWKKIHLNKVITFMEK